MWNLSLKDMRYQKFYFFKELSNITILANVFFNVLFSKNAHTPYYGVITPFTYTHFISQSKLIHIILNNKSFLVSSHLLIYKNYFGIIESMQNNS